LPAARIKRVFNRVVTVLLPVYPLQRARVWRIRIAEDALQICGQAGQESPDIARYAKGVESVIVVRYTHEERIILLEVIAVDAVFGVEISVKPLLKIEKSLISSDDGVFNANTEGSYLPCG
jgi:hypothetical protein